MKIINSYFWRRFPLTGMAVIILLRRMPPARDAGRKMQVRLVAMVRGILLCAGLMALGAGSAVAETMISCGGSEGKGYYFQGPMLPASEAGWRDDAITGGGIAFVSTGDRFDILIKDALGMISATSQGAHVQVIDIYDAFVTVLVNYPKGSKELYTFDFTRGKVAWSQHRFGVTFDKAHTMVANCD
jgi:hypothetical protein